MKILQLHKTKIFISLLLSTTALSGCNKSLSQSVLNESPLISEEWQVIRVSDGDTIAVRQGQREIKIRFCGIDAPEIKHGKQPGQPFGNEAREKLRSLVALAKNQVTIIPIETDRYGRTVAEVTASVSGEWGIEMSFQEEMLKSGNAYYYKQYASNCPNHLAFEQAEKIAIASKAGVWSQPGLEKPWDYRRQQREK
ncbi:thermonuclease family protein [Nostoc sp.]